jgi:OmpA-OmpF porin, OOP family
VKRWLIVGSLALVSTTALADQTNGFYLGGSAGNAKYDLSKGDLDAISRSAFLDNGAIPLNPTSSYDDSDTAWSLIAGYRFNQFIAVEGGYMDLGSTKYRNSGNVLLPGVGTLPSTVSIDLSAKGAFAAAKVAAPIGPNFDIHSHVGTIVARTEFDIGLSLGSFRGGEKLSSDSADFFAGAGVGYRFTDSFAASVDYLIFKDVGDGDETGEGDIKSFRIGVTYTFPR